MPLHSSYHSVYASFPRLTDTKLKNCSASTWEGIVLNYKITHTQGTHILYMSLHQHRKAATVDHLSKSYHHTWNIQKQQISCAPRWHDASFFWSAWVGSKCATRSRFLCTWRKYLCSSMVSNNCISGVAKWWDGNKQVYNEKCNQFMKGGWQT